VALTTFQQAIDKQLPPVQAVKTTANSLTAGRNALTRRFAGLPVAAAAPSAGLNGVALDRNSLGAIPMPSAVQGQSLAIVRARASLAEDGVLWLIDKLWENSGLSTTVTTPQLIDAPATVPTRDDDGTNMGRGVFAAIECIGNTGAGTPTITLGYTNEAGVTGRTATNIEATLATSRDGQVYRFGLQDNDKGVRVPESVTLSATWTSGALSLFLYRPILMLDISSTAKQFDVLSGSTVPVHDDAHLSLMYSKVTGTNAQGASLELSFAQG